MAAAGFPGRFVLVALLVGGGAARAGAGKHAARRRHGAPTDDIEALEKQLREHQISGAMYPSLRVARRIHELKEKKLGPDHPETIRALEEVATYTGITGNYPGAIQIRRQLLARAEKLHGAGNVATAQALEGLATQVWQAQQLDEAERLYERVLALRRKQYGPENEQVANYLQTYAALAWGRQAYAAAEERYLEALAILDKAGKTHDLSYSGPLMGLGYLYWSQGQWQKAVRQFDRVLAIEEKFYTETARNPALVSGMLLAVASIYSSGGRADLARPLEERAARLYDEQVAETEKQHGPHDSALINPLMSLAQLHQQRKEWDAAEKLYRRAMAIHLAGKPPPSPVSQVTWLVQLAALERQRGRPRAALPLLEKVRSVYQKSYGGYMASTMDHQIADLRRELGDHGAARRIMEKVIRSSRRTWGPHHPMIGSQLATLAMIHMAAGQPRPAVERLHEALEIQEQQLALILATGSESDHATYFGRIAYELNMAITLHTRHAPADPRAARLALTTVLRRKGRILDAAASSIATLRGKVGAGDQQVLDELAAARAQLAALIVAGPSATDSPEQYSVEVARLEREVKRLEDQVRRKSAAYRIHTQPIELAAVQRAIPADGVLVEIVVYQPYDATAPSMNPGPQPARRYGAYLLRRTGEPTWAPLGEAAAIDAAATAFLGALADPTSTDVNALGRALHDLALKRLVAALGQGPSGGPAGRAFAPARAGLRGGPAPPGRVLIAPDGLLNLVPFGAVVDGSGRHLVERFNFSYLTSGRDLLRLGAGAAAKQGPVIVADPRFDLADDAVDTAQPDLGRSRRVATRGRRSRDLSDRKWEPLPGTAEEADALIDLLGREKLVVLRGSKATEAALKKVSGPRILHIATHGFFLPASAAPEAGPAPVPGSGAARPPPLAGQPVDQASGPENPLLRSGLVLAGANRLSSGGEDGILTALEAAGLDLWGTRLVVLSACETGVGKVTDGDGVHGLRRALVIAGAESLVMSLWQVDDRATRELMTGFYRNLMAGEGRSEALRQVQLQMLRRPRTSHPYYWASFVPTGSWTPLPRQGPTQGVQP